MAVQKYEYEGEMLSARQIAEKTHLTEYSIRKYLAETDDVDEAIFRAANVPRKTWRNITIDGQTKTMSEWCKLTGLDPSEFRGRMARGWDEVTAMFTPVSCPMADRYKIASERKNMLLYGERKVKVRYRVRTGSGCMYQEKSMYESELEHFSKYNSVIEVVR